MTSRGGNADGEAGIFLRLGVGDGVCVAHGVARRGSSVRGVDETRIESVVRGRDAIRRLSPAARSPRKDRPPVMQVPEQQHHLFSHQ